MGLGGALAPLQERPFRLLWLGRVSSGVGDALVPVALAFAVLSVHDSYTAVGEVLAAFTLARVSFTLVGGVIADRLPRRGVMLACDLVRGVVQAFTAVMLLAGSMTLGLFVITMVLFGAASAFFVPASDGLVQQTVSRPNLQSANALLSTSRSALNVFGPVVSGTLIAAIGTGWVFGIDAVSFAVSAVFLTQLTRRLARSRRASALLPGAPRRLERGDLALVGARADDRLRDLEHLLRVVPRARPRDLPQPPRRPARLGHRLDLRRDRRDRGQPRLGALPATPAADRLLHRPRR